MRMYKIFDMHTHNYPAAIVEKAVKNLEKFYSFVAEGDGTAEQMRADGHAEGLAGFLVLGVATNPRQVRHVNEFCASVISDAKKEGFKAYGFMGLHQDCADMQEQIEYGLSLGLSGIKIHPDIQGVNIDDRRLYPAYEIMQERDLPICFHMGDRRPEYNFSATERLVRIHKDFPHLRTIAAHLGGYTVYDEGAQLLSRCENVWVDTSSALWIISPEHAGRLISEFGHDRVFFGTDYPVKRLNTELEYFMKIKLNETQREDILYNNAAEFLGIE